MSAARHVHIYCGISFVRVYQVYDGVKVSIWTRFAEEKQFLWGHAEAKIVALKPISWSTKETTAHCAESQSRDQTDQENMFGTEI